MSLPLLCGTTLASVPAEMPYVRADPARVEYWKAELADSTALKVGISWQGNPQHRFDQHRSFRLQLFSVLAAIEGIELYSLQKGPGVEQLKGMRFPVVDLASRFDESAGAFTETAAAMQALDLVIACDSAIAHLAGAMDIPIWLVLSAPADWRWMLDVSDTPWYPSMRIFRQTTQGQWGPVFEAMQAAIGKRRPICDTGIKVEVAPGELFDKLTILQIKSERIQCPDKLRSVRAELRLVEATCKRKIRAVHGLDETVDQLKKVNEILWDVENDIRARERAEDFGSNFIHLARAVYHNNDRRAAIKRQINELLGAKFREEKEYEVISR